MPKLHVLLRLGVRDYLHVEDLASGHLAALKKLMEAPKGALLIHNLGTGRTPETVVKRIL